MLDPDQTHADATDAPATVTHGNASYAVVSPYLADILEHQFEVELQAGRFFGKALVGHHLRLDDDFSEWDNELPFVLGLIDGIASRAIREEVHEPGEEFIDSINGGDLPGEVRDRLYKALVEFMDPRPNEAVA